MAHFVKINENNVVVDSIVIDNADAPDPAPEHSERIGQEFICALAALNPRLEGQWKQTSYNGNFRKQFAGIGFTYDPVADVFICPRPYPSWQLDNNFDWQPPSPVPSDGVWSWSEDSLSWIAIDQ